MADQPETTLELEFDQNRLLPLLFGEQDRYLSCIEEHLGIAIYARGNHVLLSGKEASISLGKAVLLRLYKTLKQGAPLQMAEVESTLKWAQSASFSDSLPTEDVRPHKRDSDRLKSSSPSSVDRMQAPFLGPFQQEGLNQGAEEARNSIFTSHKIVRGRTPGQAVYVDALYASDLVFAIGPAGTGKTYLAVAMAVSALLARQVERIILSRPAVEAGENLGFLPGDLREKVDPYLRPLYDALYDLLPSGQVMKRIEKGEIEVAPLAFMRGRTLSNAFIILDEAQNTTHAQMKMALTRLGKNSRMVVTGDLTQVDLPTGVKSGMKEAVKVLHTLDKVRFIYLKEEDIVRHPLVQAIVKAYDRFEKKYSVQ